LSSLKTGTNLIAMLFCIIKKKLKINFNKDFIKKNYSVNLICVKIDRMIYLMS
jgi:hypothetical protein